MKPLNQKSLSTIINVENIKTTNEQNKMYTQRFYKLIKLIRISKMISNAKIVSSPKIPKN